MVIPYTPGRFRRVDLIGMKSFNARIQLLSCLGPIRGTVSLAGNGGTAFCKHVERRSELLVVLSGRFASPPGQVTGHVFADPYFSDRAEVHAGCSLF